jgi:hypothetical protein
MPGTPLVGRVEHEFFVWEQVILMVFEVKHMLGTGKQLDDYVAQVMCEMCCESPSILSSYPLRQVYSFCSHE